LRWELGLAVKEDTNDAEILSEECHSVPSV
jgi:hypothetical protein